jgi:iron complex transport system substrate-binding protein
MKKLYLSLALILLSCNLFADSTHMVTDMAGQKVIVPDKIEGVLSVGGTPAINTFLFAFGKADIIKNGVQNEHLKKMPFWKHQQWFMPKIFELPQVSTNPPSWTPDFEKMAQIKFDLAFVNDSLSAQMLQKRGYRVVVMNWQGENIIERSMTFMGELFNMQNHAKEYIDYYHNILKTAKSRTEDITDRKSALFLRLDNLMIPMVSTSNDIFKKAGGISASEHIKKEHALINMEQLFVFDPDYLFVWGKGDLKLAYNDPKFKDLKAVKNHNVYTVPLGAFFWTNYTPEQALCILWAAKKMYPEEFKDIDMQKETRDFYRRFMKKELTTQQLREILSIKEDQNQTTTNKGKQ